MRDDSKKDRRARIGLRERIDICCGCGKEMPSTEAIITIWCESCVPNYDDADEEEDGFDGDVCPMCEEATENLHPDDGLCPTCEGEWSKLTRWPGE